MRISTKKQKKKKITIAYQGKLHIRCRIVTENKTIEWASGFNYLGFNAM
jgi:hypothetical protein